MVQGYLAKAREKLRVAETLLAGRAFEDAVSRAYYAAFHATQAVLLTEGLTAGTHQGLVNLFGLHLVKTGKFEARFGRFLANLKDDREDSDYEVFAAIDEATARHAVDEARQLLTAIETYLGAL
ncbi:MAG: hypothetical protein A3C53_06715 [Omnitrophica WOR_2 bacterium RIFCSPHIGHO2_02_FULL_68_15]|nr:MAG: hypothetical protein A3C53_06715 [Omnitrophica WOR_2 bacterium RIFCSPHIGHO2_02_FULL_68_15]